MKDYLYCIFDKVSGQRMNSAPIPAVSNIAALVGFLQFCDQQIKVGLSEAMYDLYQVGEFYPNGDIIATVPHLFVSNGKNAKEHLKELLLSVEETEI